MGCDIHCYIEHRQRAPYANDYQKSWDSFAGRINPGRWYFLFGRLAGVRGEGPPVVGPRGIPDDLAYAARDDWWSYISDTPSDGWVSREAATRYVTQYGCATRSLPGNTEPTWVQNPDWHDPAWLTPDEWALALEHCDPQGAEEYRAMLAAMRSLEADGREVRVVFWFDN